MYGHHLVPILLEQAKSLHYSSLYPRFRVEQALAIEKQCNFFLPQLRLLLSFINERRDRKKMLRHNMSRENVAILVHAAGVTGESEGLREVSV